MRWLLLALGVVSCARFPSGGLGADEALVDAAADVSDAREASIEDTFDGIGPETSVDDAEAGAGASLAEACEKASATHCAKLGSCAPHTLKVVFGDVVTCEARVRMLCLRLLTAPGTLHSPDDHLACAKLIADATCDRFLSGRTGCLPRKGKLAKDQPCAFDTQCASGFCPVEDGTTCGKCAPPLAVGDACVTRCGSSELACIGKVCRRLRSAGEACEDDRQCFTPLACVSGQCMERSKPGEACDPTGKKAPPCDPWIGYMCPPTLKCSPFEYAKAGEYCGPTATFKVCTYGAQCIFSSCMAPTADGLPCDATKGPPCLWPSSCVGGLCKGPDPVECK